MKNTIFTVVIVLLAGALVWCTWDYSNSGVEEPVVALPIGIEATEDPPAGVPPTVAVVEISRTEPCSAEAITVQTTTRTCHFVNGNSTDDPEGVVCQNPSDQNPPTRAIRWVSATGDKFTLEFLDGHPFTTSPPCTFSTLSSDLTCKIRQNTPVNPVKFEYKYGIKFEDGCYRDPRIYLIK